MIGFFFKKYFFFCASKSEFKKKKKMLKEHCIHYPEIHANIITQCKQCPQKTFACKKCHDEKQDHPLDKSQPLQNMQCTFCDHIGPVGFSCAQCKQKVCVYFCTLCHLISDNEQCFHCDPCGICWNGKTMPQHRHCETCDICVFSEHHQCQVQNTNGNCCVCHESWKHDFGNSIVHGGVCGHFMHNQCFYKSILPNPFRPDQQNYFEKCPCCHKSMRLYDHEKINEHLNEMVAHLVSKELLTWNELKNIQVNIECNDCEKKSENVPYRLFYHGCEHCHSCNTSILKYHGDISEDLLQLSSLAFSKS